MPVVTTVSEEASDDKAFRFLELPAEIRLHVLKYTDLVTPLKEVYWNDKSGFFVFYATTCDTTSGSMQNEHFHYACQFRQCRQGYGCSTQVVRTWDEVPGVIRDHRHPGCFNRLKFIYPVPDDWNCRCWAPPRSLFLVCRRIRDEAELMFFTENRFVLTSSDGFCKAPASNPARFAASIFLERLRPSAARSLRMLEIVFPPFQHGYCPPHSEVLADWTRAVQNARDKLYVSHLVLRIYMTDHLEFEAEQDQLPDFRKNMTPDDGAEVIDTCKRILAPLAQLSDLKSFFLHLSWPWEWVAREEMDWGEGKAYCQRRSKILEQEIGESIVGKDLYMRSAAVERSYAKSQWLAWAEMDCYV